MPYHCIRLVLVAILEGHFRQIFQQSNCIAHIVNMNSTSTDPADFAESWMPEPNHRGTWGFLYSCLFTIVLCVWSTLHLNIPGPKDSQKRQWLRKIKWVFIGIFATELVVYCAMQQYYIARRVRNRLRKIAREQGIIPASEKRLPPGRLEDHPQLLV